MAADANWTAETAVLAKVVELMEPLEEEARLRVFDLAAQMLVGSHPDSSAVASVRRSRRLTPRGRAAISSAAKRRWEKHRAQRSASEEQAASSGQVDGDAQG